MDEQRKSRFRILIVGFIVILTIALVGVLYFRYIGGQHEWSLTVGEEISGYPVEQLAFVVNSWQNTNHFSNNRMGADATENTTLILVNYTLRNTRNVEFDWYHDSVNFNELLRLDTPILEYNSSQQSPWSGNNWAENLELQNYDDSPLAPNQSIEGVFLYSVPKGSYPTDLVCTDGDLQIVIDLNRP